MPHPALARTRSSGAAPAAAPVLAALLCGALALPGCGGDGSPGGAASTLQVRTPAGIGLVQFPFAGESGVNGLITVTRKGATGDQPVSGAQVRVNGVVIPESSTAGAYDPSAASSLSLSPGDSVTVLAIDGADQARVAFGCPADVALTAPGDQGSVSAGQAVSVAWSGRVGYSSVGFAPAVYLRPWSPGSNIGAAPYSDPARADLVPGATSATLTVPADGKSGYAVELVVPGNFADQSSTGGQAICLLVRRARLMAH